MSERKTGGKIQLHAAKKIIICKQPDNKTVSGLSLAEDEKGKSVPELGVVKVIGTGETPLPVKVGDTIVFRRYADNRISVKGEQYNFIRFRDVMAVVKD